MLIEIVPHQYTILDWVKENRTTLTSIFEIGVGKYNYTDLIQRAKICPNRTEFIAIEPSYAYIHKYALLNTYNKIFNMDCTTIDYTRIGYYDLTLLSVIFNHLSISESYALIENCLDISKVIVLSIDRNKSKIPVSYIANMWKDKIKLSWENQDISNTSVFWLKNI